MFERLTAMIARFEVLRDRKVKFVHMRYLEAVESLKHISWWGVCLPTTCCYQYIFRETCVKKSQFEVYQWFMSPGLGTTYRIKNYWVHLMLAGLFSHCTSSAIYIVDGRAYFGRGPKVSMFAWGGT